MFLAWTTTYITMLIKGSVLPKKQVFSLAISQHTLALSHPDGLSVSWTYCVLLLLGGFVSNASFSELPIWTLSFTSFKTAQASPVDFCWLSPSRLIDHSSAPPHPATHNKMLLMARVSIFQLLSEPLDCLNCILLFLVRQVSAVIPGELNKFFEWIHFLYGLYYFLHCSYKWDYCNKI